MAESTLARYSVPPRILRQGQDAIRDWLEAHKLIAPGVYSVTGLAFELEISESVVTQLCQQGWIPGAHKAPHRSRLRWHIPQSGVDELLDVYLQQYSFMEMLELGSPEHSDVQAYLATLVF